jgi:hypothetical protein
LDFSSETGFPEDVSNVFGIPAIGGASGYVGLPRYSSVFEFQCVWIDHRSKGVLDTPLNFGMRRREALERRILRLLSKQDHRQQQHQNRRHLAQPNRGFGLSSRTEIGSGRAHG